MSSCNRCIDPSTVALGSMLQRVLLATCRNPPLETHQHSHSNRLDGGASEAIHTHAQQIQGRHSIPKTCNKNSLVDTMYIISYHRRLPANEIGSANLMMMHKSSPTSSLVPRNVNIHWLWYLVLARKLINTNTVPSHLSFYDNPNGIPNRPVGFATPKHLTGTTSDG